MKKFDQTTLLLAALGAYQAGVYEGLADAGVTDPASYPLGRLAASQEVWMWEV
jgi:hypothetical protein